MNTYLGAQQWRPKVLKDLVFLQRGFDITKAQQQPGEVPVFSSGGPNSRHNAAKASGPGVIIGRKGTLGSVYYSEGDYWPHDTTLWSKSLQGNNPRFVFYALKQLGLERFNVGGANPTLNRNHIHDLPVRIPQRATQDRIAQILSAYDDLIENNRRRIALLEESARLLYREWFVQFRFPGHERVKIVDGIPEGWERVRLADRFDTTSGGTPSRTNPGFFAGSINWVKTQELDERPIFCTSERVTEEAIARSSAKLLPAETLLVSIYGNRNIGRTGVLARPSASNQACVALLPKRRKQDWVYAQIWLREHREEIVRLAQGSAQTNISQKTLRELRMLWPPNRVLDAFLENALPGRRQTECLSLQNTKLADAQDALLPRLMNGEAGGLMDVN